MYLHAHDESARSTAGLAHLWGNDDLSRLGQPAKAFPPKVQAFLDQVEKEPKKHEKLLLSISNTINRLPVQTLGIILRRSQPKVLEEILKSANPSEILSDVRTSLAAALIQHKATNPAFAALHEAETKLGNEVDTAFTCVITYRRLRHHLPRLVKVKTTKSMIDLVQFQTGVGTTITIRMSELIKIGRKFVGDEEFVRSFPRLVRRASKSTVSEIIWFNVGLNLVDASLVRQKDAKTFKRVAEEQCKAGRQAQQQP